MIQKESANTFYAKDNKPPAMLTAIIKKTPNRARTSLTTTVVAAPVPLLLPLPLVVDPGLPEDGALGTNVPVALERQELATRLAFEEDDALEFTVPFPPKLHAWALRFSASKYSLITKESRVAVLDVSMKERETSRSRLTGVTRRDFTILPRLAIGRNCTTTSPN